MKKLSTIGGGGGGGGGGAAAPAAGGAAKAAAKVSSDEPEEEEDAVSYFFQSVSFLCCFHWYTHHFPFQFCCASFFANRDSLCSIKHRDPSICRVVFSLDVYFCGRSR